MGIENTSVNLKPFYTHGVLFTGSSGKQHYGDCPFCGKEERFYVNSDNGLWDCKRCGRSGNLSIFLGEIADHAADDLREDRSAMKQLTENRGLPKEAFEEWNVGKNGTYFTIPIQNEHGYVHDIRRFKLGAKMRSTAGCHSGLFGLQKLAKSPVDLPVYLCEGEWDAMALNWLLKKINKPGVVVGTPGSTVFKKEWIPFFENRRVYVLYDNDDGGEYGEKTVTNRLQGVAKELAYLHWSPNLPKGYDIRDFVVRLGVGAKKPKRCYDKMIKMLRSKPRASFGPEENEASSLRAAVVAEAEELDIPETTLRDVLETVRRWLYLPDESAFYVALATVISNEFDGDPLWTFVVAPPGGSKTEMLNAFSKCRNIYMTSSLTANTLISGFQVKNGPEPSLLPKLDGKILLLKDFTAILGKHASERDEIFSQLRDAYDGKSGKNFGTGDEKKFESHFSILAGVTPQIYQLAMQHQALGERFIKIRTGDNLLHINEEDIVKQAIRNLNKETAMRDEIATVTRNYLHWCVKRYHEQGLPELSDEKMNEIIAAARWCARLRGIAPRDAYRHEVMTGKPSAEVATRLGKTFTKLAYAIAIGYDKRKVDDEVCQLVRKVTLDTSSQQIEDIVRRLYLAEQDGTRAMKTVEIAIDTRYSVRTLQRIMSDLHLLGIVERVGSNNKYMWKLSPYIIEQTERANLYRVEEEINRRITTKKFRIKSGRKS